MRCACACEQTQPWAGGSCFFFLPPARCPFHNLVTSTAIAIDDGVDDVGEYLPDIDGIELEWKNENTILVSWEQSNDPNVRSYIVYISDSEFDDVKDATNVGESFAASSFEITVSEFSDLSNDSSWWIGVAAKDDLNSRQSIDSQMIDSVNSVDDGDGDGSDSDDSATDLGELLTSDNMVLAGMILIALLLLVLVVRGRGNKSDRNKEWELQEATWGIQARDGWDDTGSFGGNVAAPVAPPPGIKPAQQNDIYAAAQRIQQPTQPVQQQTAQPQNWSQPVQKQQPAQGDLDTSFLDDLL